MLTQKFGFLKSSLPVNFAMVTCCNHHPPKAKRLLLQLHMSNDFIQNDAEIESGAGHL